MMYITRLTAFAESYDPLWYARVDKIDGVAVQSEPIHPVPLYSVINGFYVNRTGNLDITIEYELAKGTVYIVMAHVGRKRIIGS